MEEKRDKSDQYYSCQCIRNIIGKIRNDLIHTGLASRLRKIVSDTFQIDDKEMAKLIANFYWKNDRKVGFDDFIKLTEYIYKTYNPPVVLDGEMGEYCLSVIAAIKGAGWNTDDLKKLTEVGIKYVEKQKNKKKEVT